MDYSEVVKIAEAKLGAEYPDVVAEIKSCIRKGSTGGEIAAILGNYLQTMQSNHSSAYNLIKETVDTYLSQFVLQKSNL